MWIGSSLFTVVLFVVAIIVIAQAIRVVPQQHAWVVERLGRFYAVLQPGLNFVIPFVDRVAFKHDLREIPFDVPSQICITKDNTQLQVDGILYWSNSRLTRRPRLPPPMHPQPLIRILAHIIFNHFREQSRIG